MNNNFHSKDLKCFISRKISPKQSISLDKKAEEVSIIVDNLANDIYKIAGGNFERNKGNRSLKIVKKKKEKKKNLIEIFNERAKIKKILGPYQRDQNKLEKQMMILKNILVDDQGERLEFIQRQKRQDLAFKRLDRKYLLNKEKIFSEKDSKEKGNSLPDLNKNLPIDIIKVKKLISSKNTDFNSIFGFVKQFSSPRENYDENITKQPIITYTNSDNYITTNNFNKTKESQIKIKDLNSPFFPLYSGNNKSNNRKKFNFEEQSNSNRITKTSKNILINNSEDTDNKPKFNKDQKLIKPDFDNKKKILNFNKTGNSLFLNNFSNEIEGNKRYSLCFDTEQKETPILNFASIEKPTPLNFVNNIDNNLIKNINYSNKFRSNPRLKLNNSSFESDNLSEIEPNFQWTNYKKNKISSKFNSTNSINFTSPKINFNSIQTLSNTSNNFLINTNNSFNMTQNQFTFYSKKKEIQGKIIKACVSTSNKSVNIQNKIQHFAPITEKVKKIRQKFISVDFENSLEKDIIKDNEAFKNSKRFFIYPKSIMNPVYICDDKKNVIRESNYVDNLNECDAFQARNLIYNKYKVFVGENDIYGYTPDIKKDSNHLDFIKDYKEEQTKNTSFKMKKLLIQTNMKKKEIQDTYINEKNRKKF